MTTATNSCWLSVSEWRDAPFQVEGETIFAIGDVHGCAGQASYVTGSVLMVDGGRYVK